MKITKQRLKEIIAEEIKSLSEVDNNVAQIQTAQHLADEDVLRKGSTAADQTDAVNNSDDENIIRQVKNLISGLTDSRKQEKLMQILDAEIEVEQPISEI
jgi:hypothetical protein